MNQTLQIIRQRRSIRRYKPRQIPDEVLSEIVQAALYAPTDMNQQKWHFTIVQNDSVLAKMDQITRDNKLKSKIPFLVRSVQSEGYHTYYQAPTVVLISGEQNCGTVLMDCAAAAQTIALAAESLGIGSCIMTSDRYLFASAKGRGMRKKLGIPDNYEHVCSVVLGYKAAGRFPAPPRNREIFNFIR